MVRVTEYFGLNLRQSQINFVDVDVDNDVALFIDPRSFLALPSTWAHECLSNIQSFFQNVLNLMTQGDHKRAKDALSALREPNEIHFGLCRGRSRGSGMGEYLAEELWRSLSTSSAVRSGLIQDLEDTALLVDGIGTDRISDITANLVRRQLIKFTQDVCSYYGIPMEPNVSSGALWNNRWLTWEEELVDRPMANGSPLLLVPKSIARRSLSYSSDEYYRYYIVEYLQDKELGSGGSLVKVLKNGRQNVTKQDVVEKYGNGKPVIRRFSNESPETLERYREHKAKYPPMPLDHSVFDRSDDESGVDFDGMLKDVLETPAGNKHADAYHRRVEALLSAMFYPVLVDPLREFKLHEGRKRVDIAYTNAATSGFFAWLSSHYPSAYVFVECKNYSRPVGNPEYDQLSGRFSPSRGKFGILMHRGYDDKRSVVKSCRDTVADQRGFLLALDDEDLKVLVEERKSPVDATRFDFLQKKFNEII